MRDLRRLIFAIDPGNRESAYVLYDPAARAVLEKETLANDVLLLRIDDYCARFPSSNAAIEMIASYGMAVGADVFETVYWIGRFAERWWSQSKRAAHRVFRREVKLHLCGTAKAKDPNVRQALIDMFGPGKDKAIGKAKAPGPLFGVSGDAWAALAVAVTFDAGQSGVASLATLEARGA